MKSPTEIRKSILLVEDDRSLGEMLQSRLSRDYDICWRSNFQEALDTIQKNSHSQSPLIFDLAIFDIGLPGGNGFDLAVALRKVSRVPLIFLTAQSDAESRLRGFELGAEEYIPKPFHLKELLLRIDHVLKSHLPTQTVELNDLLLDFTAMTVLIKKNQERILPPLTDLKVLKLLIENAPQPISRDKIIDEVWGADESASHRTVDNIIVRLRQLLGESDKNRIRSVRGLGYQWTNPGDNDK